MPDFERITDQLKVDLADRYGSIEGKGADYWSGYRDGKSKARWQVVEILVIAYFVIALIGEFFS